MIGMAEEFVSPSDIKDEISFIEGLMDSLSTDDEYLHAILENQRLFAMKMLQDSNPGGSSGESINIDNLPLGFAGVMASDSPAEDSGTAIFSLQGSSVVTRVKPVEDVSSGEVVRVSDENNVVRVVNDVDRSDIANISETFIMGAGFDVIESGENVSVDPGEEKIILEEDIKGTANWWESGTNDEKYTEYQYIVDGDELLDDWKSQPLGLYNDMYRFPRPIRAVSSIKVKVRRSDQAPSSEEYYSKITITE